MSQAEWGVIGGSGLYALEGVQPIAEVDVDTPFGRPSDKIVIAEIGGKRVAFVPRHGRGHRINPTEIPVRANIWALKSLGVRRVLSISAVGSLREEIAPLHLVVPDQLIDRTRSRVNSFFDGGIVVHAGFADPFCPSLRKAIAGAATESGATVHDEGTYVVMEGPLFSTRAESNLYRSWGASVIGMTALPEAKLAREAEMCYAILACSTDYDCWHPDHDDVTVEIVIRNLNKNVAKSQQIIKSVVSSPVESGDCGCQSSLATAIITDPKAIPLETLRRYDLLVGKYVKS